jgi:hypothetical protein
VLGTIIKSSSSARWRLVRFGVQSRKLSNVIGVTKIYYLEFLRAPEGTLSCWSRLHLQSLAPTNHWDHVVGYGLFSLCVIHKEGLCPSSGDINRLMMIESVFPRRDKVWKVENTISYSHACNDVNMLGRQPDAAIGWPAPPRHYSIVMNKVAKNDL